MSLLSFMLLSVVMSVSCFPPRGVERQYVDPLGLNFRMEMEYGYYTVKISFGETEVTEYPNYYETSESGDCGGSSCYFVVDNTSGRPNIKHIFFEPMEFYDIHIPDYPYSIVLNPLIEPENIKNHVRKLPIIDSDSALSTTDYYIARVWPTAYDRYLDYHIYDISSIDDVDEYISSFVKTPDLIPYAELEKTGVPLGFQENMSKYGSPDVRKRLTLTEDTKKNDDMYWMFVSRYYGHK